MGDKYRCPVCRSDVAPTEAGRFRKHNKAKGVECDMSRILIPQHVLAAGPSDETDVPVKGRDYADCPACGRTPVLDSEGRYGRHLIVPRGSETCPMSGKAYQPAGEDGTESECETNQYPESTPTRQPSSEPSDGTPQERQSPPTARTPDSTTTDAGPNRAAAPAESTSPRTAAPRRISTVPLPPMDDAPEAAPVTGNVPASTVPEFRQPDPPFEQPGPLARVIAQAQPMTDRGREIAARIKETFYAYTNRLDRSQQTSLGPSEIGTPCDRRIAMSVLRIDPVNPGGDNWASFVGTCVHAGLAEMFLWANADTGRYAVEVPLKFPSVHVPRGTGDLLDRTMCMFLDHKLMGRWSLDKLTTKGPSPVYRTQVHTYAYGARLKGEVVDHVAIIGWPREAGTLDDLYVWTEPYDPTVAIEALDRVERIAAEVKRLSAPMRPDGDWSAGRPMEVAREFGTADDCRFCPFHAPGDSTGERGCNGKR